MKVLVIEPFGDREGHFRDYTLHVCRELSSLGLSVTVVTSRLGAEDFFSAPPGFGVVEVLPKGGRGSSGRAGFLSGGIRGIGLILDNIRVFGAGLRLLRRENFDVVHVFDCEPVSTRILLGWFFLLSAKKAAPLLFVVHAPDPSLQGHGNRLYQAYGMISRPMFRGLLTRRAAAATVHGTWKPGEMERLLGFKKEACRFFQVPYGAVIRRESVSKKEARRRLGIEFDGPLLLFFGMIRKDKGVDLLIEAMGRLDSGCRLLLAGMPFDFGKQEINSQIQAAGAGDRIIRRLEYIPDGEIPDYFRAADALVLPYRRNYMGAAGPLKTALGFGKPVIASEVRELSHYMAAAPIGFSFPPGDGDALGEAIRKFLASSEEEREALSRNGRTLAEDFSWSVVGRRFAEIYREVAGGGGSPP